MDITRGVPAALLAAISGPYFHPVVLMHVDWPGAPLWMHSNRGNIAWQGKTWLGVGKFGQVEVPEEIAEGIPADFSIALFSDFPDLEDYLDTVIRGRDCRVYLGATTEPGGTSLIGAVEIAAGTADGMGVSMEVMDDDGQTITLYGIRVTVSTGPSSRSLASISHSHEDQQRHFPGDTAGRHLMFAQSQAQKTLWPEP